MALTRGALQRLNKQLAPQGRRICSGCGRNLPLDRDHWYFRSSGDVQPPCKRCRNAAVSLKYGASLRQARLRYYHRRAKDPAYRQAENERIRKLRRRQAAERLQAKYGVVLGVQAADD